MGPDADAGHVAGDQERGHAFFGGGVDQGDVALVPHVHVRLGAVEDEVVAVTAGGGLHQFQRGTDAGLGDRFGEDAFAACDRTQILVALFGCPPVDEPSLPLDGDLRRDECVTGHLFLDCAVLGNTAAESAEAGRFCVEVARKLTDLRASCELVAMFLSEHADLVQVVFPVGNREPESVVHQSSSATPAAPPLRWSLAASHPSVSSHVIA